MTKIMKEPEVRKADVSTELELPMYDAIAAGFPITSDYVAERPVLMRLHTM